VAEKRKKTGLYLLIIVGIIALAGVLIYLSTPKKKSGDSFLAPGKNWNSPKKVEDYFVEMLNMSPDEAIIVRQRGGSQGTVDLRLSDKTTLEALIGNLYYYGFIRNQESFRYALLHTDDMGSADKVIVVDEKRAIDVNAEYRISEDMDAWQIADILLNKPSGRFDFDEYGYFFMP